MPRKDHMPRTTATDWRLEQISKWPEKTFQQQVINLARQLGWKAYHPYDSRRSVPGYPDLTLCHAEHGVIWAELKTEKGRVSPAQREWLDHLTAAGQTAVIWRPRQWADRTIHEALSPGCR